MRSGAVTWGIPDFGDMLDRPRLVQRLNRAGNRLRVISAPSGWGKTVLASQFCASLGQKTVWVELHGSGARLELILTDLSEFLQTGSAGGSDCLPLPDAVEACRHAAADHVQGEDALIVVFDDITLSSEQHVRELELTASSLRAAGVIVVVTTRTRVVFSSCASTVGVGDLRLMPAEAERIVAMALPAVDRVSEGGLICEVAEGHPALLDVLLSVGIKGVESGIRRRGESRIDALVRSAIDDLPHDCSTSLLMTSCLLGTGDARDLEALGYAQVSEQLSRISEAVPLFAVVEHRAVGSITFRVHDLVQEEAIRRVVEGSGCPDGGLLRNVCRCLTDRGDISRAARLLLAQADTDTRLAFLDDHADDISAVSETSPLVQLAESIPAHRWVESPRRLLSLARCLAHDDWNTAASRARAAYSLAQHEGDDQVSEESMALWLACLGRAERYGEAAQVARGVVSTRSRSVSLSIEVAMALVCVGEFDAARAELTRSRALIQASDTQQVMADADLAEAAILGMGLGDFRGMSEVLSPALVRCTDNMRHGTLIKGNLAYALCEMGRVDRAISLASAACSVGIPRLVASFLPISGAIRVGSGDVGPGLEEVAEGIRVGIENGMEVDTAGNRVLQSCMLRASGLSGKALTAAERAYECLLREKYMGLEVLAALEVAASLVALGDVTAGRRWAENAMKSGCEGNAYHALRASMILAECDRREGKLPEGITRLSAHLDHLVSESSNWQIAMYVRAFPDLLGMFATAVGVDALPVHMLKMVLPEYGELGLRSAKAWMDPAEWRALGVRVLGDKELARLERRGGEPVCRVRMFGGLDVAVGERMIGERDWKKRKARLLFAMLVAQRGQDLSRDQILEHLWPEMLDENARNNFYVAWSAMKSALMGKSGNCAYLENTGGRCRIVVDAVRSDIDEFEEALSQAREAENAGDRLSALDAYGRLMTVYRGDLLPADVYDDWFALLRDRYRLEFVDAMLRAAQILLEQDDPCEALVYARRALSVDPLREDLYQATLRCHIAAGQRSGAIDTFIQCRTRLVDDLGLDPSAETMSLYQEVLVMEDCPRYDDYGL